VGTCSSCSPRVGWTSLAALPFIRQPTLILAGADDPIIPLVNARIMPRLLPDATLHVYDDGHLALITQRTSWRPSSPTSCSTERLEITVSTANRHGAPRVALFNPHTYNPSRFDDETRRLLRATID
jgi:hypothetical protein